MLKMGELQELNNHRYAYAIHEPELNKANELIELINSKTKSIEPQPGDYVEYLDEHGSFYKHARIERIRDNVAEFCENPSHPFTSISRDNNRLSLSMSGGAWGSVDISKLVPTEELREASFKAWGRYGACANGAFTFNATVKVWKYEKKNKYAPYSTKDYTKHYVSFNSKFENDDRERYLFKGDGFAFENHREFNAWLLKNRAVAFKGNWSNQYVIFIYKRAEMLVSEKHYNKISHHTEEDYRLMNGSYIPIKRVVDSYNKTILEYRYTNGTDEKNYDKQLYLNDARNKENEICIPIIEIKEEK